MDDHDMEILGPGPWRYVDLDFFFFLKLGFDPLMQIFNI